MSQRSGLLYHLAMGVGFLYLIGSFYLMQTAGFTAWVAGLGPASHRGTLQLVAIMVWMTPTFLLWKYYVRWLNRTLRIKGIYYEDSYYNSQPPETDDRSKDRDD